MIRLKLSNKSANEGVNLDLPATPAEIGEAFSWFERIGVDLSTVRIAGVNSPVPTLGQYILRADIHDPAQMKMLNEPYSAFLHCSPHKSRRVRLRRHTPHPQPLFR